VRSEYWLSFVQSGNERTFSFQGANRWLIVQDLRGRGAVVSASQDFAHVREALYLFWLRSLKRTGFHFGMARLQLTALVTGGVHGIGEAMAQVYAQEGARVFQRNEAHSEIGSGNQIQCLLIRGGLKIIANYKPELVMSESAMGNLEAVMNFSRRSAPP